MSKTAKIPKITDFYYDAICLEKCKITNFISFEKGQKVKIKKIIIKFADPKKPEKELKTIKVGKNQIEKQVEIINKDVFCWLAKFSESKIMNEKIDNYHTISENQLAFFNIFSN